MSMLLLFRHTAVSMLLQYSAVRPFFHFGASLSKQQSVNGKNLIPGGMFMENKLKNYFPLIRERKPANKKSSVFLKKISKIRFDILCITFKPPEMPVLKVVI